jgi:hypothetical protein
LGALRGRAGRAPVVAGSPGEGARAGVVGAVDIAGVAGEVGVDGAVVIAGVAGEVGRCRGGRPRRGGAGGAVSAVPVCGFRRSTVTAVLLPPMSRRKYLGPLSSTLYGPL